jgi:hypothetical protein
MPDLALCAADAAKEMIESSELFRARKKVHESSSKEASRTSEIPTALENSKFF